MKCSQCGTEFEGKFCPACGKPAEGTSPVDNASTTQQPPAQGPVSTNFAPAPVVKKKPFYKRWWFVALAIIVALGVFGSIVSGGSNSKTDYEELKWSSFTLHEQLPEPKSKEGKNVYDNSDSLTITVGNTEKSEYKDYVEKCETEYGFTVDKSKSDSLFSASNADKYQVMISYDDSSNEMRISLSLVNESENTKDTSKPGAPSSTDSKPTTSKPTETKPTATKPSDSNLVNGMHKDFKEAMDSYEKFMDEYVAFMKKYNDNPSDISLLADYAKYMSKYADMCSKFEKWESEDMNDAETAYYIDVQARVSKKLLEVAN